MPIQKIPSYSITQFDSDVSALYDEATKLGLTRLDEKILFFSNKFLGRPYLLGALGEGPDGEFDQNPLYRSDAFDCVTYVNTVLSLALSHNLTEFRRQMIEMSYATPTPDYLHRYHFISNDWNLFHAESGLIKNITADIVNESKRPIVQQAQTLINRPNWFRFKTLNDIKLLQEVNENQANQLLEKMRGLADQVDAKPCQLDYLPLVELFDQDKKSRPDLFDQIPDCAIIEIVRPNWDLTQQIGTHLNISHLGFAVRKDHELIFRHASSVLHKVVDEPLSTYLSQQLESPTVKGIHVLKTG